MRISPGRVHATLRRLILADGFDLVVDLDRSRGSFLYDARRRRRLLDFHAFVASLPLGYNHPRLLGPAFSRRLLRAARTKVANPDLYTVDLAEFALTFHRIAGRPHFHRYFFISGGTLGVENALKAAFDWKVQKNLAAGRGPKGTQVIHFREAFHGRSGYALSCTNTADPRKTARFPAFDWPRIPNPKLRFPPTSENLAATRRAEGEAIARIEAAFRRRPHDIAAILIEPIQGEGGDNHFRGEFLRELRRLADEHEALLVFDEVQTGLGTTGKMWAFEHFGAVPDLLVFGKKTQVSGVAATRRIDEAPGNVFRERSRISSTFGGDLADMVRATEILRAIEEEGLVANAARVGERLLAGLRGIAARRPAVDNVRGRGCFAAFDLPSGKARDAFHRRAYEAGLLLLVCGERTIRMRPPLTTTEREADLAVERVEEALRRIVRA